MTIDHVKAKVQGGNDSLDNMQTMCLKCNQEKGGDISQELADLISKFGHEHSEHAKEIAYAYCESIGEYKAQLMKMIDMFLAGSPSGSDMRTELFDWAWARYTRRKLRELKIMQAKEL